MGWRGYVDPTSDGDWRLHWRLLLALCSTARNYVDWRDHGNALLRRINDAFG